MKKLVLLIFLMCCTCYQMVTAAVTVIPTPAFAASSEAVTITATATPATGLCSFDGALRVTNNGTSVINLSNTAGRGVNWKVEVRDAGSYTLTWRYAGGGSSALETAKLLVNGTLIDDQAAFPRPKDSNSFLTTEALPVLLGKGVNEIRIEVYGTFADIEWLEVAGDAPVATDCSKEVGSGGGTIPAPVSYTLSASSTPAEGGTVTFSPAGNSYTAGTQVSVTAAPATGYTFSGWSGALSGSSASATVTMDANKTIVAAFTPAATDPDPGPNPGTGDNTMRGYATVSGESYTTTTGGQGGRIITISSLDQLLAWAATRERNTTPEIVHISGKITASASTVVTIKHGENVSVLGLGTTAELVNVGLNFRNYKNVIVRNLKIREVFYPNDGLTIDECQHVWVDHNEFHSKIGAGIGVDTYDGLLDIKNGSRYVTVSWNYFHDHMKTVLIGHTDNSNAEAIDRQIRVTFHHNFFENTDGRNPSLRWGAVHLFNNYFKDITDYGIAARQGAHALLENNVYENVKLPMSTNKFTGEGYICERGNVFTGTSGNNSITQTDCDWWDATTLPYAYTLDAAADVPALVQANAGVGKVDVTAGGNQPDPQPVTYQLVTAKTGEGELSTQGGSFAAGEVATIEAIPATGWLFNGWSGDASGTENPLTVTMSQSKSVVATFTEITFQLTTATSGKGSINVAHGAYKTGTELTLKATPEAGWKFSGWSGDVSGDANPLKLTMDADKHVQAFFTEIEYQVATTVHGQGSLSFAHSTYQLNKTITLTATPAAGWKFTGWSGDATGETNPLTIAIEADKAVTANFARIDYELTVAIQGSGSVNLTQGRYTEGETVLLQATAAPGWQFDGWSGAAGGAASLLSLTMNDDKALTANFSRKGIVPAQVAAKEASAKVYPNPFRGSATFEFTLTKSSSVNITLYTFQGVKVADILKGNDMFEPGTHSMIYNNTSLKPGLYIYLIETDQAVYREQLLVE